MNGQGNNGGLLIRAEHVSKKFCKDFKRSLRYGITDIVSSAIGITPGSDLRKREFWAVKDIHFEVRRGECLGLIGHNGAGKSTLLKMLNGLIRPDEGTITIEGRVGALIELGTGFNPILTGRENVYNNGAVLGLSKREIDEKFDRILEFAEIGDFIDAPVQNYSSGMKVRLGFAVAAQMEPDVLIIDEVLAVGDMGFVLKCYNTIDKLLNNTAVIFVSHNMPQVSRICSKLLLMENGQMVYYGNDVSSGIDQYYERFRSTGEAKVIFNRNNEVQLLDTFLGEESVKSDEMFSVKRLDDLSIRMKIAVRRSFPGAFVSLLIFDSEQRPIGVCNSEEGLRQDQVYKEDQEFVYYEATVIIPRINLSKGVYSVDLNVKEKQKAQPMLRLKGIREFHVQSDQDVWPPIEFETIWK